MISSMYINVFVWVMFKEHLVYVFTNATTSNLVVLDEDFDKIHSCLYIPYIFAKYQDK